MRHKYTTRALVLGRTPLAEESATVTLLTEDFGLVRARAQAVRKGRSKMSGGLQTLSLSRVTLLRGKDGWRMAGALPDANWARELDAQGRAQAARVLELADRMVRGERYDPGLFTLLTAYLAALAAHEDADQREAAEMLAVVRMLQFLGVDAGDTYGSEDDFGFGTLARAAGDRDALLKRINRGIHASGL